MQIKYVTEFSWDIKGIGEVLFEKEEYIAPGFFKMDSRTYLKNWLIRKMFNKNGGEIMIRGEKNILKYDAKNKEYWLITTDEYFEKEKKDTLSKSSSSRLLFFSEIFEDLFNATDDDFIIHRERTSKIENINGLSAKKWNTTIQNSSQKLFFEEWLVQELPLKDTLDLLKLDLMESFNLNKDQNRGTSFMVSSNDFVWSADSTVVLDSLEGKIVQAKMYCERGFLKSMSFEIKELYTVSFDAASFTIPEKYDRIEKND